MSDLIKRTIAGVAFFFILVLGVLADLNIWAVLIAAFLVSWLLTRYL